MMFKDSVNKQGVQSPIWYACGIAEMIYRYRGARLTVTSMMDSHDDRPTSLHLKGLAVDFRIKDLPPGALKLVLAELGYILEPMGFDVVLETDHIHVEYQPKTAAESWQQQAQA